MYHCLKSYKCSIARPGRYFYLCSGSPFAVPGNLYKFVQWKKGKVSYQLTWGDTDKTLPANYPKFYDSFMTMIPVSPRLK